MKIFLTIFQFSFYFQMHIKFYNFAFNFNFAKQSLEVIRHRLIAKIL